MFYAHSTPNPGREDWQPLPVHLRNVGSLTADRTGKFGIPKTGLLAGLLHDLGKYTAQFQKRLVGGPRVDHATAGARVALRSGFPGHTRHRLGDIVAYAVAGHHAGLPDRTELARRCAETEGHDLDPAWRDEVVLELPERERPTFRLHSAEREPFQWAFLGRMLFSALIDADRRDTENHAVATGHEAARPRDWPRLPDHVDDMVARLDAHVAGLPKPGTDPGLNALRARVLGAARERAAGDRGLYTLTVPTGGGKTLSVMRFALGHAAHHRPAEGAPNGIERIVVAIPFTSVTEQTSGVLKGIFGEDLVLEHHSALEFASARKEERFRDENESPELKLRLAMQDWAAPVVVTTNVQLFESLFSHRPSACRKLHNLANSVIVLDEAQTIPLRLLRPCLAALDELARNYGCTIVLCTATQPAIGLPHFQGGLDLGPERELAPDPAALHDELRRTTIRVEPVPMSDDDLVRALASVDQGFVIVNSRRHALALFRRAERAGLDGLVHLTTRQYAGHRRAIVAGIKGRLAAGEPCRLVATSLIEAGIDLDFEAGWRAMAGLESIVQSAGRVNREGRRSRHESVLTVFTPADPKDAPPPEIRGLIGDLGRMSEDHPDLAHPDALRAYFEEVYWRKGPELDVITVPGPDGAKRRSILPSTGMHDEGCFRFNQKETDFGYRTVGENFRMIESGMAPVIIARDEQAASALALLRSLDISAGRVARELQPFIVQVPPRARALLEARKDVQFRERGRFGDQFPVLETPLLYDDGIGLLWESEAYLSAENCCV